MIFFTCLLAERSCLTSSMGNCKKKKRQREACQALMIKFIVFTIAVKVNTLIYPISAFPTHACMNARTQKKCAEFEYKKHV